MNDKLFGSLYNCRIQVYVVKVLCLLSVFDCIDSIE